MRVKYPSNPWALLSAFPVLQLWSRFRGQLATLKTVALVMLQSSLQGRRGRWRRTRDYCKLMARVMWHREQSRRWIHFLYSTALMRELLAMQCRVIRKIYAPYLTEALTCEQRLQMLMAHYEILLQHGLGSLAIQAMQEPVVLGRFAGKSGAWYEVRLTAALRYESEGEWLMQLCADDTALYSQVFTFGKVDGRMAIGLGCLQGPARGTEGLEQIQHATRDLHGLRPKNLMIRLLQRLGQDLGCEQLILVGNRNRVVYYAIRKGHLHADYDQFWLELGAEQRRDGDFSLPCVVPALCLESIPSKKRAEARRRAAVMAAALDAASDGVAQWAGSYRAGVHAAAG